MARVSLEHTQLNIMLVISTILTAISTLLILVRCTIRFYLLASPGYDDYMSIVAVVCIIAYLAVIYIGFENGMGFPMTTLTPDEMVLDLKLVLIVEVIYYTIIFAIKTSITFMYDRFAISDKFKKYCIGTNVFLALFFVVCIGCAIGQCTPITKAWDITGLAPGSCINLTAFFYFTSGFSILTDIWILVLPISTLRKLQIPHRDRIILFGVFGVGAFATAMSCARLYSIYTYTLAADPFKDSVLVNIWSMVEINAAVACACAPAIKPLFSPRRLLNARQRGNYEQHSPPPPTPRSPGFKSTSQSHIISERYVSGPDSPKASSPATDEFELGRTSL
ncbi:hypothetical protein F4778DRAFT_787974 [Xylariomycetidae sp. FL2044]|nr:hypothetical protein F4778DRAFT_787974 [Xylariomycetidae sp. FL2044]